jgi:ABC-2 type transport system permease protein
MGTSSSSAGASSLVGVVMLVAIAGCHSEGVTVSRIQNAVAPTFANLIQVQESRLGLPPVVASTLRATASCEKVGSRQGTGGAGEYKCVIVWSAPGQRGVLRDGYELTVTMDGCYTAKVDGTEAHLGGPTLTTPQGVTVTNLLYAFDGCFDAT